MTDELQRFHHALPAHVARWYTLDHTTIPILRAAVDQVDPAELARICVIGVTRAMDQATARRVINYRIRRAAGQLDEGGT